MLTKIHKKWPAIVAVMLTVALFAAFKLRGSSTPQYFTQRVQRGDVHQVVEATGTIDAVKTVQVGSQVSGTIQALSADFNSHVTTNEVIARIDPSLFQGAVLQAQADLQNTAASAAAARADMTRAKATAVQADQQYARTEELVKDGIDSQQQLESDKSNAEASDAAYSAAKAQLSEATAQVSMKQAALKVAQTNLDHTIIRAPIDGTVTARNVDVGQTVAASLQAPTLFTIAQDLTHMRVYTNIDESDVGQIHAGQPATFKVDAFPDQTFKGVVEQVRMNAATVQNVVTYSAVVEFDNPQTKLFPGMTAYVTIPVADAVNTLELPNVALRYTPNLAPDQVRALYTKSGIQPKQLANANNHLAVVWKQAADKSVTPVEVRTGITDHTDTAITQVVAGTLNAGDQLVTGAATSTASASRAPQSPMGGMGGGARMGH